MSSEDFHDTASERDPASPAPRQPAHAQAPPPLARIASVVGNRGFTRTIARMRGGDGILSYGVVHPDVEAAIVAARGRGLPADRAVTNHVGAALGDSLSDVRIHRDAHAAALARSVSARAFTVGSDIFFGSGEYAPTTQAGRELLTHELVHVVQQRGAAPGGPLTVSQPGDALEREAEDVSHDI